MKTITETINELESIRIIAEIDKDDTSTLVSNALYYLNQYRDCRDILKDRVIAYFGRLPVISADGKFFAIREYVPEKKAWRCHMVEISPITQTWVCCDDDNWIISNKAEILYREVGWDLKIEPYMKGLK